LPALGPKYCDGVASKRQTRELCEHDGVLKMAPETTALGSKVIAWGGGALGAIYAFWRSRSKEWGYWEMRWRLLPSALVFLALEFLLILIWVEIST
jgi:hypothetical protein